MIICASGDFHARETNTENRTDKDYMQTLLNKLWNVIELIYTESQGQRAILILPGDICDSFRISDRLKSILIDNFLKAKNEYNVEIMAVPGQHDQRFHNLSIENTPLQILASAKALTIVDQEGILIKDNKKKIMLYGCGWGNEDKIKQPSVLNADINILIIHKMLSDNDYWHGHVEYSEASKFLDDNDFDFIISGDNHNSFIVDHGNKYLINCGSWTRSRIDQTDHKPVIYLFNTETQKLSKHYIPILPADQVLRTSENAQNKAQNANLDLFTDALDVIFDPESEEFDFIKKLRQVINKLNIDNNVSDIIFEAVERATKKETK